MRALRLSLAGMAILVLVGLVSIGPTTAADEDCQRWMEVEERDQAELASATAQVEELRRKLAAAEERQRTLQRALERDKADIDECLDKQLAKDMEKENSAAIEQGRGAGTLDLPEWGLRGLPEGDDVLYVVHCRGTSLETGQDASAPFRVANNSKELPVQIKEHPNGCVPDQYYDRQLVIEVYVKNQATGANERYAELKGKYQP